jgi:hypothetical protein
MRLAIYDDYRIHIKAGFWVAICCFPFGGATVGVGFLLGTGGLVPLIMGLNKCLEGIDFSYLPLGSCIISSAFIFSAFHTLGYLGMISSG